MTLKKIIKIVAGLAVLFLVYIAVKPAEYSVSREMAINASPEAIFPYINNSKLMNDWNPWSELDPKAKMSFSGPDSGVGAKTSWEGGDQLGTGSATVIESLPGRIVRTQLDYVKPFEMHQVAELSINPSPTGSIVTWSVKGKNSFLGRFMCTFMDMDKMVGGTFEKGLSKLKTKVEAK